MVASSEGKDVLLGHKMSKLCDKLQTFSPLLFLPFQTPWMVRAGAACCQCVGFLVREIVQL